MTQMEIRVVILMGVSGSGKTTVGRLLAERIGWSFHDADDHHPPSNVEKMRSGQPLTDADRKPWIARLSGMIAGWLERDEPAVLACSALGESTRRALAIDDRVRFVHLVGTKELLRSRLEARTDHFMPPGLLDSQLAALERPDDVLEIDVGRGPTDITAQIAAALGLDV